MPTDAVLTVTATDGYSTVYTYDQVNGIGYNTYNPDTGVEQTATEDLTLIVSYLYNGEALSSDQGPLRMAIVGPEGLVTNGNLWVKFVSSIEVTSETGNEWSVVVNGTSALTMDQETLDTDLAQFDLNWTDNDSDVWTGAPLYQWISWCVDNGGVTQEALDEGYSVKLTAGDDYSVTIEGTRIAQNDNIIVASMVNGEALSGTSWPLSLVGADIASNEHIKNIVKIDIVLDSQPETPDNDGDNEPTTPEDWELVINGTTTVTMTRTQFELITEQSGASWTDSDNAVWSGTTLSRIVNWAESTGVVNSTSMASGYVVKVIATDDYTGVLDSTLVEGNSKVILANIVDDDVLPEDSWPVKLTGADLTRKQSVKSVAQIQIMPFSVDMNLTIVAANGTQIELYATDIAGLTSYTASGGTRSSNGAIKNAGTYTGVPILTLLDLVGGVSSSDVVTFIASDGYRTTVSYEQLHGNDIATYDSSGNPMQSNQTLTMIVAYYMNGTPLPAADLGQLRIAVVGPEGVITSGNIWAKFVVQIEINPPS
jgi:DMSO/TMAO reductase YedYZ molybdopterin-dependent catalytic subunit